MYDLEKHQLLGTSPQIGLCGGLTRSLCAPAAAAAAAATSYNLACERTCVQQHSQPP
eukprot:CAMPEP_0177679802 /NCGR_PEP_ID=MMETSP0447-20121125/29811_1 /TAXON_ID=0 /ORGANISM="Stygamoeba regulata, Strain BSH-02190019" /LENGTH=56 /DNA_ID=CAMNT_0019189045 /DNA_START=50 /DNA_END=217 /DNA_ORIENTATION=+